MEDAVATIPQLSKFTIEMLIGDSVFNGMSECFHQTIHFFGVYDGHGGSQVANYCRGRFDLALAEEIELVKQGLVLGSVENWKQIFTNTFLKVDAEIEGKSSADPIAPKDVGSTTVVAIISSSHIIVANCGDSRAVLYRGKGPTSPVAYS